MMPYTIKQTVQASIKIQRSEFIAFLFPTADSKMVQDILHQHQQDYAKATHNCFAYVLGYESETQYYSDAGEPGGSAGKPILNSLLRNELSGVLAIVTRYYGGIKLGVKGLIEAYTQASALAIEAAQLIPYQPYRYFDLQMGYNSLEILRHQMQKHAGEELDAEYSDIISLKVKIPLSEAEAFCEFMDSYKALGRLEYVIKEKT
ncbi:MAG: hypothetical protein PWP64_849 [Candidatus Cloacimonadota bacterium]|nr:hypothetical protein [Candidatus Cloacimonadota bacterium]